MAPYFLSWVVVSFIAYSFLSVDNGFINRTFRAGCHLVFPEIGMACYPDCFPDMEDAWVLHGHVSGFYCGISTDYYEAALMDGATKWQQIKYIHAAPSEKEYDDCSDDSGNPARFFMRISVCSTSCQEIPGPLFPVTNVIDTYVYRSLKESGNIGMAAAANLYQSLIGFDACAFFELRCP